jgi:hypothetical protein
VLGMIGMIGNGAAISSDARVEIDPGSAIPVMARSGRNSFLVPAAGPSPIEASSNPSLDGDPSSEMVPD